MLVSIALTVTRGLVSAHEPSPDAENKIDSVTQPGAFFFIGDTLGD